jgi:hypothetical protein
MSLQLAAQHLASHGRGDDKVLVHMTRGEVKSLNDLAMAHGGHLTINPHTGLPEAGFLKAMLPMVIGAGLAAATAGTSLAVSPAMAGLIVGGGYTAATGSVKKGLMAGLGAYGGAGMGSSLAASGAQTGTNLATTEATTAGDAYAKELAAKQAAMNTTIPSGGIENLNATVAKMQPNLTAEQLGQAGAEAADKVGMPNFKTPMGTVANPQFSTGTQTALANPTATGFNNATSSWQGAKDFLGANKMNIAAGVSPAIVNTDPTKPPPTAVDADQGQRYNYQANPTAAASGAPNPNIPSYEQMMNNPQNFGAEQTYFNHKYVNRAAGGPVESMSNNAAIGANTMYPMANMTTSAFATPYQTPQSTNMMQNMAPSGGGTVDQMSGEPNMQGTRLADGGFIGTNLDNMGSSIGHTFKGGDSEGWKKLLENMGGGAKPAESSPSKQSYNQSSQTYSSMATGGISDAHYNLGGYSDGGRLLRGPGDGVSDDIPAMIGEKQPARLADGEFVVPARIVSELGNGSTEAGARKLYAMMDRVQSARKKTVGKDRIAHNSRADKYLPA